MITTIQKVFPYNVATFLDYKLSEKGFDVFYIAASELQIYDEQGNRIVPVKYIKSLIPGGKSSIDDRYTECIDIVEMDATEKAAVDAEILDKARRANFFGFILEIEVDKDFADANLISFITTINADSTIKKNTTENEPDESGVVAKTFHVWLNRIKYLDYFGTEDKQYNDGVKYLISIGVMKLNTIDNDSVETIIDEKYKYIVPNVAI